MQSAQCSTCPNKDQPYSSDLTADIEKCFEAIPIDLDASDGLHKRLSKCIDWVFDHYTATHHNREPDMHITLDHQDSTATASSATPSPLPSTP